MSEVSELDNIFTMDQAIDLCSSADNTFLPVILRVIVEKLNLSQSVFALEDQKKGSGERVYKFYERPEMSKVEKGRSGMPTSTRSLDLSKFGHDKSGKWKSELEPHLSRVNSFIRGNDVDYEITDVKINNLKRSLDKVTLQVDKLINQQEEFQEMIMGEIGKSSYSDIDVHAKRYSEGPAARKFSTLSTDFSVFQKVIKQDFEQFKDEVKEKFCVLSKKVIRINDTVEEHKDIEHKMEHIKKVLDKVAPRDFVESLVERVDYLFTQTCKLKKDIGKINSKIEDILECSQYTDKRIKEIEEKIKMLGKIREILERLDSFDQWKKKIHDELEKFTEITEHLKIIKADREELDYIFEEKADRDDLLKLVTLEFFKSVQDDLSGGIVQVLEQLMRNEIEWEKALKEIHLMLDAKADSCEFTSLRRYINCKLEIIQKKLNDLIRNKLTAHSAAVKIRLLKNARCITCTAEADLNKVEYPIPLLGPVKDYEVKCICEPRTRYCGGSHTLVGSDQKLITKQRLPLKSVNATTLNFTMTEGADGRLYRTRKPKCICESVAPKEEEEEKVVKKELFPC